MTNVLSYLEHAATSFPEKTAVALDDKRVTFSELMHLSKKMGAVIAESGIKNCAVGVIAERDIDTIALFFGVVYSENFYVPIDPDMPIEKKKSIVEDSGMTVLLGRKSNIEIVDALGFDGSFFTLDDIGDNELDIPETIGESPLYMVYTSGSTGKPKGVLKGHKAIINYIETYCDVFDFVSDDIIGNQTPFFFDASAKDIYLMIKTGASIEIIPTEKFAMPTVLIEYLNEKKITFISWVPTALAIVAQLKTFTYVVPETLKKVFFVGEVMPMKYLNKWREVLPDLQYVNLYGQSELAGICCYYEVKDKFEDSAVLPMGKAMPNCKIYLVDNGEIVTETGKIGEMYIVSDTLAIEYYNDAERTAESFLVKDFGEGKVRCFKTGDLAYLDENGNFIFASRSDFQIKHMGHRIELGEIEAVAGALEEIQRCCCLYNSKIKKIVLFAELANGCECTGREIQGVLRTKLSSYMVPNKVVITEKLPLNANSKIDRQKLKESF
ncbi:MAG: AMP-binding protein [Clostridia bacterium]|nr:AMP-binding protein [Clostridia bacterium]